ncbi:MAG TPA: OmpA family protein [Hymenobacter sp.]|uniref:OmpA family protein n=1 Tax=Hymenobacter sp. TaxID=1898978 RepID=UPI002D7E363E|nr:OmpA family protein [Hymenobacter sp.]HET9505902.1 OmpA family protein [Hymenobacter sp.]
MKSSFWYGLGSLLLLAGPLHAQRLAGAWQGVETDAGDPRYYPAVLRLQGKDANLFGVLYQEVGSQPSTTVTFQMEGARSSAKLQLKHVRKLNETGGSYRSYWCVGIIAFTYDAALEKLTGHATYRPVGDCDHGTFTFYRVKLKSAATVKAGAASALRVSGRDVRWFADAELKKPLAEGNIYQTKLSKTTTFYLTQGFYPSAEKIVTPVTITVTGKAPATPPRRAPTPPPAPTDAAKATPPVAAAPPAASAPVVLPTVLFRQGTAELLPEASPALDRLAADLRAAPALRLRIAGHTDRLGEPGKNQVLSEQRAEAVQAYLVKAGVPAARLEAAGYGDTRPLHPSPDVRNRRVEVEKLP